MVKWKIVFCGLFIFSLFSTMNHGFPLFLETSIISRFLWFLSQLVYRKKFGPKLNFALIAVSILFMVFSITLKVISYTFFSAGIRSSNNTFLQPFVSIATLPEIQHGCFSIVFVFCSEPHVLFFSSNVSKLFFTDNIDSILTDC